MFLSSPQSSLLRSAQAASVLGVSKATLYKHIQMGILPASIKMGPGSVAWLESELDAVISARIAGYSESDIKELVSQITAQRKLSFKEAK
ncbi:Prophage CP4-57 regulatory protein (AlpA) [Grimontia celer]|uniref:Prophage CP4-57 regulatory protein (AlpA) n=1 Tax=Grimontia celer TaxID=1796497 RepID=A0A128EST1_9GAMM|nr:AlpA family phage regulatory protein [Grimontia celer]CZF77204.1 Prophage CP4-57 regulatory protein (AlpA) [Grimontia celer]